MENDILRIIKTGYIKHEIDYCDDPAENIAKAITQHVFEFILWLSLNAHIATSYSPMYYLYAGVGEERHIDFTKEHHITDVYQYWIDKVKNQL